VQSFADPDRAQARAARRWHVNAVEFVAIGHAQTAELAAESLLRWPEVTADERAVLERIRDRAAEIRARGERDGFPK
jgi:hypothetical protein